MPRPTLLGLLRAAGVVIGALAAATILPRLGVPAGWVPDLVLVLVAASAVLRGPLHGALLGLAAGWVVDLVPPGGSPLGATALLYAAAGAAAGAFHHPGNRGPLAPLGSLAVAALVVGAGRLVFAVVGDGVVDPAAALSRAASTVVAGVLLLPVCIAVDRALVQRRLA